MDGIQQMGLPILGIVAAAALTFYAVSFNELREKSFSELEESNDSDGGGFKSSLSSRQRRDRRKAQKQAKS
ncbi:hypothetical protein M9H77_04418 [Catharanthus roseus]|uniref:Uncharacterized protein n=1 Tax=Catharanthus roseus TaxID=4058 RepID=A0ACC0CE71_CATRO|nr:hypothetical protein M9H77_04418 [Catharanthus roseus]